LAKTILKTLALVLAMLMVGAFAITGTAIAGGDEEKFEFDREDIFEDELELEDIGLDSLLLLLLSGVDLEDLLEEEEEEELELEKLGIDID
jgi:hypothetical protein